MEEALELIAKAKAEKAEFLDLGDLGLTEIPDELFELEDLKRLNLGTFYWDSQKNKWVRKSK